MGEKHHNMGEDWRHGLCGCCDSGCCVVCCCNCCCHPMVRCKIVEKYNLGESSVVSCCFACCCGMCSAAQIIQEAEFRTSLASTCCGCSRWTQGTNIVQTLQTVMVAQPPQQQVVFVQAAPGQQQFVQG